MTFRLTDNEEDHCLPEGAGRTGTGRTVQEALHQDAAAGGCKRRRLKIHANNVKRVIRALEFYHQTGENRFPNTMPKNGKKNLPIILPILC